MSTLRLRVSSILSQDSDVSNTADLPFCRSKQTEGQVHKKEAKCKVDYSKRTTTNLSVDYRVSNPPRDTCDKIKPKGDFVWVSIISPLSVLFFWLVPRNYSANVDTR